MGGGQIQFFMSDQDEAEFVTFASDAADSVEESSDYQWFFHVGPCKIQLLRCQETDGVMTDGRIALRTNPAYGDYTAEQAKQAEKLFNKLQRWLKNHYVNDLTVRSTKSPDSQPSPHRRHWIGPNLLQRLKSGKPLTLSQNPKAIVVYELE